MFVIVSGFIFLMSLVVYIVVRSGKFANHHIEDLKPDNPLLLTIQAMEGELDELRQNNAYMKHIQKLEKQIQEARAYAEALSKVAGNYGSTMEEVGESMQCTIPKSRNMDDVITRQNTAIYRTYTRQAGWSTYHDVKFK